MPINQLFLKSQLLIGILMLFRISQSTIGNSILVSEVKAIASVLVFTKRNTNNVA